MSDFPDAANLTFYTGLSPRTNQSETSTMSSSPNRTGNKN
ncbi:transposase [Corynebacterium kefirresidentii]|nr:transposase [Corynebacterium kefirresidentii]MDN8634488.1 transposase [Corynebacterium kefirresidentii]